MKFPLLFLFSLILLTSCDISEKEKNLKLRETTLLQKEQEFETKKLEFEALKALRDSLQTLPDTLSVAKLPEYILGKYAGKMICTESDCSEDAIGDLRNDQWEIFEDGVRITNKSGSEKLYKGKVENSELKLKAENPAASQTSSEITLQLTDPENGRIKGLRELKREGCLSKFSIELEKIKK